MVVYSDQEHELSATSICDAFAASCRSRYRQDADQRICLSCVRPHSCHADMLHRLDLSADNWYDLWHLHPDMDGLGNANPTQRVRSLRKLKSTLSSFRRQLRAWPKPHQCWALVDPADSAQDAVYVHTPNPNKPNYPYQFRGVLWGATRLPHWIRFEFPTDRYKLGRSRFRGYTMYWILHK